MSQLPAAELERYLRRVRDKQAILDFSIFQEGQERDFSSVSLDEFYVPLRIVGRPPDEAVSEGRTSEDRSGGTKKVAESDLLSTHLLAPKHRLGRHLALLGDAGSGKTTILRHLTGALAHARLTNDLDFARAQTGAGRTDLVPLFVPLRYYHHFCRQAPAPRPICRRSFLDFLPAYFQEQYDLLLGSDFFRLLLTGGQCLLALDGFDEVPEFDSRRQVIQVIRDLATDSETGQSTIMLSSRVAAYGGPTQLGGSFQTLWVQNLNAAERAAQVERWVAGISPHTQRQLKAGHILSRMPEGSPLDRLAVTPMIVTTLCVVYFYDHELPEQRAQLYRRCVDIMLHEKLRPDEPGQVLAGLAGKPDFKRQLLARLAFEMHRAQQDEINKEQAARWLKAGFKNVAEEEKQPAAVTFLAAITSRGTLLQERSGRFGFGRQHLTFREFLAGYHLILGLRSRARHKLWPTLLLDDRWREPIRLAAGATVFENTLTCEDFLGELMDLANEDQADPATRLAGYKLAAEALWDLGQAGRALLEKDLQTGIIQGLAARLVDPAIAAPQAGLLPERVVAGQVLGRLGDPRQGVITLPPLLTPVMAGKFLYGKEKQERETAPFQAGVYPVTNAQFAQFMKAGGYNSPDWWSEAGLEWLQNPPDYRERPVIQPEYWTDERFNNPNHPVVGVSWYEAEAFCNWLTTTCDRLYRLPTEEEWERLARGQHGREYPWGNKWEEGLSNTKESGLGQTSAVGIFPGGVSPTGAYDCAGNVWEWGLDWFDKKEQMFRVLRGGAWISLQDLARCAARDQAFPSISDSDFGFRVVSPI